MLDSHVLLEYLTGHLFLNTLLFGLLSSLIYAFSNAKRKWSSNLPPGPAPWPVLGNLPHLGALPYRKMAELAEKHGPLMSLYFGPKLAVIVSSSAMAKEILQTHDKLTASRIATISGNIFSNGGRDIILSPYGPFWRKTKKLANIHLLTQKRLRFWLSRRLDTIQTMSEDLWRASQLNGGVVEVRRFLQQASLNIIMLMTAGKTYRFASNDDPSVEGNVLAHLVQELLSPMAEFNLADFIPLLAFLDPQGIAKRSIIARRKFDEFANALVQERIEKRNSGNQSRGVEDDRDFVDVLLDVREEEELSDKDINSLILDMFLAGTESSSSITEWALAELMAQPERVERLKDELRGVELSPQTDFSKLPYLQAVIKETYRCHNSAPLLVPRTTVAELQVNGYKIPQGTNIFINAWAIFHDSQTWTEPMEFRPERFLEEDVDTRGHDFRLIPFGSGRRICPGMSLGHSTVEIMLATLIQRFKWTLPHGVSSIDLSEEYFVSTCLVKPLKVHLTKDELV